MYLFWGLFIACSGITEKPSNSEENAEENTEQNEPTTDTTSAP